MFGVAFLPVIFELIVVHPIIWTQIVEAHFYMAKLTREQKLEIYHKRKEGNTFTILSKEYGITKTEIKYLIRLIDNNDTFKLTNFDLVK